MSEAKKKTTADKSNAYSIHSMINQAIFKKFIEQQVGERFKNTAFARFDRPMLSSIASTATSAVMKDPHLNVVLRKER